MPPRSEKSTNEPPSNNRDIREFITPPRVQRSRRIVESDSSDDQNQGLQGGQAAQEHTHHDVANDENADPEPIQISDSDSSDSMYVARQEPERVLEDRNGRAAPLPLHRRQSPQQQLPVRRQRQSRQQHQPLPPSRRRNHQTRDEQLLGEASSTSASESSAMSADESDEDAADLYRSAIMGVRNRPNAVRQVRRSPHRDVD